jgi:hypothetical protein
MTATKKPKYEVGDQITFKYLGDTFTRVVREVDRDDPSEMYQVKNLRGEDSWWVAADDVEGGGWDESGEDKYKTGDECIINDKYDSSWYDVMKGVRCKIVGIDENDPHLHYKIAFLEATDAMRSHRDWRHLRRYVTTEPDYGGDMYYIYAQEEHLDPSEPDLPSYNPDATVSESMGMWRPPKVS